MKISVVTVCYNVENILEQTIKSVIGQTYGDLEYIIIDGASKDKTLEVINKFSDKIAYWVSEPDKGIYDAMNKGIKAASGDYIIFMNAGDRFADDEVVEKIVPKLGNHTILLGRWNKCYLDGSVRLGIPKSEKLLLTDMPLCHQATFISLPYHKKHLFDTSYKYSADYEFFYKAWRNNENFGFTDTVVADFLMDEGATPEHIFPSILERSRAWRGEQGVFARKLHLIYMAVRIKIVMCIKRRMLYKK